MLVLIMWLFLQKPEVLDKIYSQGCLKGFGTWLERNTLIVGIVCLAVILPQVGNVRVASCEFHGLSNHRQLQCCDSLRSKLQTSTILVFCEGNPPVTRELQSLRASYVDSVSLSWRHHRIPSSIYNGICHLAGVLCGDFYTGRLSPCSSHC